MQGRKQFLDLYSFALLVVIGALLFFALRNFQQWRLEIIMVAGFIVLAIILWKILALYLQANIYDERKDFVDLHAKILGGAALIISLLFTWQGIKLNQRTSETTQRVSLMMLQEAQRRQIEDRFNRAIEQIGNEKIEARLGAIYSLGKIASDSIIMQEEFNAWKDEVAFSDANDPLAKSPADYHWQIMQLLTSYVRGNASKSEKKSQRGQELSPDIQAVLDVLGWRKRTYLRGEDQRLELYKTDLRGAILKDKEGAKREGANLEGAQLWESDLEGVNLRGIHLEGAILRDASLKNAYLYGAYFSEQTDLNGVDLECADLGGASGLSLAQLGLTRNWEIAKQLPQNVQEEYKMKFNKEWIRPQCGKRKEQ